MTTFLVLSAALVLFELVTGARVLRRDRPVAPPASHAEWSVGGLPSSPYSTRH
jgi:hypothetical protein